MKKQETTSPSKISYEECVESGVHNTDTVISAFDGELCKRCLRK